MRLVEPSIDVLAELVEGGGSGLAPPLEILLADPGAGCAVGPKLTLLLLAGVG